MSSRKLFSRGISSFFQGITVLFVLAAGLGRPTEAQALGLAIEVNTTSDVIIKNGKCSLPEAITNANRNWQFYTDCTAGLGDDGIFFSNALGTATITLTDFLPKITDFNGLTIDGGGDITISGNDLFKVFEVSATGVLALDNLTVRNGNWVAMGIGGGAWNVGSLTIRNSTFRNNTALSSGGGVYNTRTGRLTVINSNFSGNHAASGGGIFNEGGSVTIQNSNFSDNQAAAQGGGIYTMIVSGFPVNALTITGSNFNTNQAGQNGGAIYSQGAGILNIREGSFSSNNSSDAGGGIYNDVGGSLNLSKIHFASNASSLGGAMYNRGGFKMEDSTFKENSAWYGGAIYNDHAAASTAAASMFIHNTADHGAGIYNIKGAELTITSNSFTDNIGDGIENEDGTILVMNSDFSSNGNGIFSHSNDGPMDFAVLRVWDSTFSKNRVSGIYNDFSGTNVFTSTFTGNGGSGVQNVNESVVTIDRSTFRGNIAESGGGIFNANSDLHLRNSTLTENKASYGGGLYNAGIAEVINVTFAGNSAKGNNIFNDRTAQLHLYNTILTNGGTDDCQNHAGPVDGINNLIRSTGAGACELVDGVDGNIIGQDADLAPLSGSPAYYPLNNGSLAIDAGDDAICAMLGNQSQNGVTRPQGAHCDIGSYEMQFNK